MSFESSHAREHATTLAPPVVVLPPPGKHSATERLSAPVVGDVAASATGTATSTTSSALCGTSWLDGVLGFGESGESLEGPIDPGEATGKAEGPEITGRARATPLHVATKTAARAPSGAPDTRRTVGVGETVVLTANARGTWSMSSGTKTASSNTRLVWTAGDHAGTATVTFHHGNRTMQTKLTVVSPNTLAMKLHSRDTIPKGEMGAGMVTNVTIGPASVSFGNVEWLEVPGGPTSIWGYFKDHDAPNHHPNPSWLRWNAHNGGLSDHAMIRGYDKPWSPGGFTWVIPNKYRVTGTGSGYVFIYTHQVFRIADNKGTVTVTKGGAGVTRSP